MSDRVFIEKTWDGTEEYAHFDAEGNLTHLQHVNDHSSLIDHNTALKNEGNRGYGATKEWKHIASIPVTKLIEWANEKGVTFDFISSKEGFDQIVMKYLADSDFRKLRVDI